jgi:hypothetical protein
MASSHILNNRAFSPVGEFLSSFVIMQSMRYTRSFVFYFLLVPHGTIHGYNLRTPEYVYYLWSQGWLARETTQEGVI